MIAKYSNLEDAIDATKILAEQGWRVTIEINEIGITARKGRWNVELLEVLKNGMVGILFCGGGIALFRLGWEMLSKVLK